MRECRTYGSVRGARGNPRPYRDPGWFANEASVPGFAFARPRLHDRAAQPVRTAPVYGRRSWS